jgi:hypothetical protein
MSGGIVTDDDGTKVRGFITAAVLLITVWWLWEVSRRIGTEPVKDDAGNVTVDEYQRAKDILLVVLPLVTTAFGFWFGSHGKEKAEKKAEDAERKTEEARAALSTVEQEAHAAERMVAALRAADPERFQLVRTALADNDPTQGA